MVSNKIGVYNLTPIKESVMIGMGRALFALTDGNWM